MTAEQRKANRQEAVEKALAYTKENPIPIRPPIDLHPAAAQVCLACFFAMAYKEMPPFLPRQMFYDGKFFHANEDRRRHKIILTIKHQANSKNSEIDIMEFDVEAFRRITV